MCTRSGRPLLEHDDRSLWERPRGLGSPGSLRRAGGGADASGSGASAATCPTGTPGDSAELLPASAMGSGGRRPGARGGPGSVGCAVGALGDPGAARRAGRLDARRREAGRAGGRRKRTEKFAQEGAAYSLFSLPPAKAAGLGARPPSVPANLPGGSSPEAQALPLAGWQQQGGSPLAVTPPADLG